MEWVVVLAALILFAPLSAFVLRSMNLMKTEPTQYYDFTLIFKDTKPWTIGLYIAIIGVLTFVVLLLAGVPVAKLPA